MKEKSRIENREGKRVAVTFPHEVWRKVKRRADHDHIAFSAKALELIQCGLFDYEESEKHEPGKGNSK